MQGSTLWLAVDNMTSCELLKHFRVTAPDMAELLRRIHRLCQSYDIKLKVVHVPGVDLELPDETSRELMFIAPAQRLTSDNFDIVRKKGGHPTRFLGREREHGSRHSCLKMSSSDPGSGRSELSWMNPPYTETASYLECMHENLRLDEYYRALILVPCRPDCRWWSLTDGLNVLHVWDAESDCIEEWRGGGWRPLRTKYKLALLSTFKPCSGSITSALNYKIEQLSVEDSYYPPGEESYVPLCFGQDGVAITDVPADQSSLVSLSSDDDLPRLAIGDWVWQSYDASHQSGVHGCIYLITSTALGEFRGTHYELKWGAGATTYVFSRSTNYMISDDLRYITDQVHCAHCKRQVNQCRTKPWHKCDSKKVCVYKTQMTEIMTEECPEFMEEQISPRVQRDSLVWVVCGEDTLGMTVASGAPRTTCAHPQLLLTYY